MRYSVLMSVYIKEKPEFLNQAVTSMINQTYPPTEIVIVQDGPLSVELEQVLEHFLVKFPNLIRIIELRENRGLGVALSVGLNECAEDIVCRMDTDDISYPSRCETQVSYLLENQLDIVGSNVIEVDNNGNPRSFKVVPTSNEEIYHYMNRRNPFNHMSVCFLKSSVIKSGGYKEFLWFEDYYLWLRMRRNGCKMGNLKEALVNVRTNQDFYQRRGGRKYWRRELKFFYSMYKQKLISFSNFITNILLRSMIRLAPNKSRQKVYTWLLRKNAKL